MDERVSPVGVHFPGSRPDDFQTRLDRAVADFGSTIREPLADKLGHPEIQIGPPAARLVQAVGRALGLRVITHAETPLSDMSIRPDFTVKVADSTVGFIEIKRPGKGADPTAWSTKSHDGLQWQKLSLLPNVLYTDGTEWALYHDGQRVGSIARLNAPLDRAGRSLAPVDDELARVLEEFLWHTPSPPRDLRSLVRAVARLCRYLRDEVVEVLQYEGVAEDERPFTALAEEWRALLFPRMTDDVKFADAYAQTVTFALLLARSAGVAFDGRDLPSIGRQLGKRYALIGKALAILSDSIAAERLLVIETMRRVIGAVNWDDLDAATAEAHATLYETFLQEYDPELRRLSGSYYTPDRVARSMVRLTNEILREKLDRPWGYANDDVIVVDPAMGTGTFLVEIVTLVADIVANHQGDGARAQRLRELFQRRLIGFERQVTPYAVAELRLHETLKNQYGVDVPSQEMRFLADTFDDPDRQELEFGSMYKELRRQREGANHVIRDVPVMVVIGNPPYLDRAHKRDPAPWIEEPRAKGRPADVSHRPSLDEFRQHGRLDYKLAATWVFYWRWAIWKAFEAHPDHPAGIVSFITPSSYLTGAAFAKMRSYLRAIADEAWIIDVSPERHQPPVPTRLFPDVQQPLCIAIFARYGRGDPNTPAIVHHLAMPGISEDKLKALDDIRLGDPRWCDIPAGTDNAFAAPGISEWVQYPTLGEIFPWHSPGVKANRTWVIAPTPDVLQHRWKLFTHSSSDQRDALLKVTRDRTSNSRVLPLSGEPPSLRPLRDETDSIPLITPYSYRSFDRQCLIRDPRLIDYPRSALWNVSGPSQVFVVEPHSNVIDDGPGLVFSATVPDMDYFQGHHGGRVLPLYRDAANEHPNIAPGLLDYLQQALGRKLDADGMLAYIAAVVAHPAFTRLYRADLIVPGIRVPLSKDCQIWDRAIQVGSEVLRLHLMSAEYANPADRILSEAGPSRIIQTIPYTPDEMPETFTYDRGSLVINIGRTGIVGPVSNAVWDYRVGGMRIVDKWIRYRLKSPRRRPASSILDTKNMSYWPQEFNDELLRLLSILHQLVELEPAQSDLLSDVCGGPMIYAAQLHGAGVLPAPPSVLGPVRSSLRFDQLLAQDDS